jgi:hypothetical protein
MKTFEEWTYNFTVFFYPGEVSGQLHVLADLSSGKDNPVIIG